MKNKSFILVSVLCLTVICSCSSNKACSKEYTLLQPTGNPVEFNETWGFVTQNCEKEYDSNYPLTDVCYYHADVNCYGELTDAPKRSKLNVPENTRVHFGMCCESTSLTHFVICPEFGYREKVINQMLEACKDFDGLQLDFEYVPKRDKKQYLDFVKDVKNQLMMQGKKLGKQYMFSVCVPGRIKTSEIDFFNYKDLSEICDRVFVMVYDEHWATSKPGPIASTEWSKKVADYAISQIPSEKLVIGIPFYGRTWTDKSLAKAWYLDSVVRIMDENNVSEVFYEDDIPMFKYKTDVEVTCYFNDLYSSVNLCRMYSSKNIKNIGFWRIGFENPDFWDWIQVK